MKDPELTILPAESSFKLLNDSGRRLFQSTQGYLRIVTEAAREGDEIFFVPGCTVPLFRKKNQSGEYELVGEAYIHGVMYGELWREGREPEWASVTLV